MNTVISKASRSLLCVAMSVVVALGMCAIAAPQEASASSGSLKAASLTAQSKSLKKAAKTPHVVYSAHEQNYGWLSAVKDGKVAGKAGKDLRTEALTVTVTNKPYTGDVSYRTYVEGSGWTRWSTNGAVSGTVGKSKRIEALQVKLTGKMAKYYDIYYSPYVQSIGWMGWAKNGAASGTFGKDYRIEAVKIKLVSKGKKAPGSTANTFKTAYMTQYKAYVKSLGWKTAINGNECGTTGAGFGLKAFSMEVADLGIRGNVIYRAYRSGAGWTGWRANGEKIGSAGSSYYIQALEIDLTNNLASKYDIYYRVYNEKFGWMGWAKNSSNAGTFGYDCNIEAVQVKLVTKGGAAPGSTENAALSKTA